MLEFLDLQGVINPGQYGFRLGHSSAMVIQDNVERVRGAWDSKRVALGVFTDLKKAIDIGSSFWASAPQRANALCPHHLDIFPFCYVMSHHVMLHPPPVPILPFGMEGCAGGEDTWYKLLRESMPHHPTKNP
jgi:hypothetical protein